MDFIFKWKGSDPQNKEFIDMMTKIWGECIPKHLSTACQDINWLDSTTKFCDRCYLSATKLQIMSKVQIDGEIMKKKLMNQVEIESRNRKKLKAKNKDLQNN